LFLVLNKNKALSTRFYTRIYEWLSWDICTSCRNFQFSVYPSVHHMDVKTAFLNTKRWNLHEGSKRVAILRWECNMQA